MYPATAVYVVDVVRGLDLIVRVVVLGIDEAVPVGRGEDTACVNHYHCDEADI